MDRQHAPWDAGGGGPIRRRPSTRTELHRDTGHRVSIFHGGHCSTSVTSVAADDAIQRFLYLQCLARAAHTSAPHEVLQHPAVTLHPTWTMSLPALPENPWFVRALAAGVLIVATVSLALACVPRGVPAHSVAGVVLVGKQPLVQGRIVFHPTHADPAQGPLGYQIGRDGSFQSDMEHGIPAGLYLIVVESDSAGPMRPGVPASIPAIYRDIATTPLRVHVTENLSGLRLLIRK
jgi:hypothetical protein